MDLGTMEYEEYPESWTSHQFRAMGSDIAVWLELNDSLEAEKAFIQVETIFEANEQVFSRFRPDSELSWLNRNTGRWLELSDVMWNVLDIALAMAIVTDGRFDPTILNTLETFGYSLNFEQLADRDNVISNFPGAYDRPGWSAVELDPARQALYLPPGVTIDLGGIVKGFTAQQAVEQLRSLGPGLVDAGGDLVAGQAPSGYPGWPVSISTPLTGSDSQQWDLCNLWLANQALATSGTDYRRWLAGGRVVHHLIDPFSGAPAQTDALTVTILSDDAAQAEAWATASVIAGSTQGMEALLDAGMAGLMVTHSGVVLVTPLMQQVLQLEVVE